MHKMWKPIIMKNIRIIPLFLLLFSLRSSCSEEQRLVFNNNDDEVTGLSREPFIAGEYTFQYRSKEDYDKNSCTRPVKKIVDYVFCENRDSCCIRNGYDPKNCSSCCFGVGIPFGVAVGPIGKFLTAGMFTDPENMSRSFCSRCACNFSWFPSCTQQFNCGETIYPGSSVDCCGETMAWGSSAVSIVGCTFLGCLALKKILKEKGKNDGPHY